MKKIMKIFTFFALVLGLGVALAACGPSEKDPTGSEATGSEPTPTETAPVVKVPVSDTEIRIGNTVALSGGFAFVGVPFQAGIEVALRKANEAGGVHGRTITLVNRDDGGDPTTGVANTKSLVEEDKVFAIVGHFAATVGATIDYLQEKNVPMFYAANGTNLMYAEGTEGNPIFPVQPISKTDGRMMLARALTNPIHGANGDEALKVSEAKIGVLKAVSSGSAEMHEGIVAEAAFAGLPEASLIVEEFDATNEASMTAAANAIHVAGVDAILVPLSQQEYKDILPAIIASGNTAPVYGSYFVADPTSVPETFDGEFKLYANAWLDITSEAGATDAGQFVADIMADSKLTEEEKAQYSINAFTMAGYIAGTMFIESVRRMGEVATKDFTAEAYIASNESEPFKIPMGGYINYENGDRLGIADLALLEFIVDGESRLFLTASEIEDLASLQGKYVE